MPQCALGERVLGALKILTPPSIPAAALTRKVDELISEGQIQAVFLVCLRNFLEGRSDLLLWNFKALCPIDPTQGWSAGSCRERRSALEGRSGCGLLLEGHARQRPNSLCRASAGTLTRDAKRAVQPPAPCASAVLMGGIHREGAGMGHPLCH